MRRHWVHKIFFTLTPDNISYPADPVSIYITNVREVLLHKIYSNPVTNEFLSNPFLSGEDGVLEFWTDSDVDFVMLICYKQGIIPSWYTWTYGTVPQLVAADYYVVGRVCEKNGISIELADGF